VFIIPKFAIDFNLKSQNSCFLQKAQKSDPIINKKTRAGISFFNSWWNLSFPYCDFSFPVIK